MSNYSGGSEGRSYGGGFGAGSGGSGARISSYASYIAGKYAGKLAAYAPEAKEFISGLTDLAMSGKIDDRTLYRMADSYATLVEKNHRDGQAHSREYYMKPFVYGNGLIRYIDMNGHGELTICPTGNGMYSIKGPKEFFELVGGRGMLSTLIQNLDDGDFFHTSSRLQAKKQQPL